MRKIALTRILELDVKLDPLLLNNPDCEWDEVSQFLSVKDGSLTATWLALKYQGIFDAQ